LCRLDAPPLQMASAANEQGTPPLGQNLVEDDVRHMACLLKAPAMDVGTRLNATPGDWRVSQQAAQPATGRQLGIQGANRSKEVLVNRPVPRRCSNGCV